MRYWMGVVSKEHVQRGVKGGFAQVCHGKKGPLSKIAAADGFVYYSPKISMGQPQPCKAFTAIGKIKTGKLYQVEMTPDFQPFRVDVDYYPTKDVPIADLLDQLNLTQKKSWGMQLLRGILEITQHDFELIEKAMRHHATTN